MKKGYIQHLECSLYSCKVRKYKIQVFVFHFPFHGFSPKLTLVSKEHLPKWILVENHPVGVEVDGLRYETVLQRL
jgi:hypothetical protein